MQPISIRFAPWMGLLYFAAGGLNLVAFGMTQRPMQLILGLVFVILGVFNRAVTPVVITDSEVQLKNGFGSVMKRFEFGSLADLELLGNTLYLETAAGEHQKITSLGFHLNGADKDELRRAIERATAASRRSEPERSSHS